MLLIPITLVATILVFFTTPLGNVFRRDYEVRNSFLESMIKDLG